ncbi:MAG TPA: hypothetical protein VF692_13820 [Pyrinomonadaceae bacterium]|jgi:hypothetical protein
MKISRYIYIPFYTGATFALGNYLLLRTPLDQTLWNFVVFAVFGFAMLFYNDYKARKLSGESNGDAYKARQKRTVLIFANYDKAFDSCLDSISVLQKPKIKQKNKSEGIIEIKTGMNWNTFGNKVAYKLKKLTDVSTEVELNIEPFVRTVLIDNGESFKRVNAINEFLDDINKDINRKSVEAKKSATTEFYFNYKNSKEKVN